MRRRGCAQGPAFVMAGLVPAIHAVGLEKALQSIWLKSTLQTFNRSGSRTAWMTGTSPVMTA